jgi:hypothetical protein
VENKNDKTIVQVFIAGEPIICPKCGGIPVFVATESYDKNAIGEVFEAVCAKHGEFSWQMRDRDADPMRIAALKMQVAVAQVLETGGLFPDNWWEQLIDAQRGLAAQTRGTRAEFAALRGTNPN